LISALSGSLDDEDHAELLEVPIQRAAALLPTGRRRDIVVDQLLGYLEVDKIQDPAFRSRLKELLAAGDLPRPSEPAGWQASWESPDLRDIVGAEVHETLAQIERDALTELVAALRGTEGEADGPALLNVQHAFLRIVETAGLDAEPVQELITSAAQRLAREPSVRPSTPIGDVVAQVLIDKANGDLPS
jgi:hypothetical protein